MNADHRPCLHAINASLTPLDRVIFVMSQFLARSAKAWIEIVFRVKDKEFAASELAAMRGAVGPKSVR
ncbi:hypothetical protein RvY_14584 [Ramazzottius varieornatus]|uniref:Uncharacterized protein n=1 Tax=Ramazzottius varieornatus TaxID=947166 RepID=A0A1D1VTI4_RAMVA|nr:hypothetical protein RvY_14584 [Ramazzottius varieornatus]